MTIKITRLAIASKGALGFSLVEVMVGLFVGMLTILVMFQLLAVHEGQKRSTTSGSDAYQNGVLTMHLLQRELVNTGNGLASTQKLLWCSINAVNAGTAVLPTPAAAFTINPDPPTPIRMAPVVITDGGTAAAPDSITVMYGASSNPRVSVPLAADPSATATALNVGAVNLLGFNPSDLILAVEQTGALPGTCAVAQVRDTTSVANSISIAAHASAPFNRTGGIGTDYSADTRVVNLGPTPILTQYGVANGGLVAVDLLQRPSSTRTLADSIVNLQAQYGVDTNGDDAIDAWQEPTGANWAANDLTAARIAQIKAIRLGIVVRSNLLERTDGAGNCTTSPATLTPLPAMSGTPSALSAGIINLTAGNARCYRYKVFETVVPLRNVIWSPLG